MNKFKCLSLSLNMSQNHPYLDVRGLEVKEEGHVMTGCDANSCFYGHGKKVLFERMAKSPEARSLLSRCGEHLPLRDDASDDLKAYIIRYVYGDLQSSSLDLARAAKWIKLKKKSLMRLPPDDDSVIQHIKHANFLAYIQRHPELKRHPSPCWTWLGTCQWPLQTSSPYTTSQMVSGISRCLHHYTLLCKKRTLSFSSCR